MYSQVLSMLSVLEAVEKKISIIVKLLNIISLKAHCIIVYTTIYCLFSVVRHLNTVNLKNIQE